jgi:hypothetical protein
MARNSPSGKGRGGFSSSLTRRARKHNIVVKTQNRLRNILNKEKAH